MAGYEALNATAVAVFVNTILGVVVLSAAATCSSAGLVVLARRANAARRRVLKAQ